MANESIKAYFDEAGNTGCVLLSANGILNFKKQPVFTLGSVIVKSAADEARLIEKYKTFKQKFGITGEIKGSDLMTRRNNELLEYVMDNILDDVHYRVNIYDKRFYLSTLLMAGVCGIEFQNCDKQNFYRLASILPLQDDSFFEEYCKYISNPTAEKFTDYLKFLINYPYRYIDHNNNGLVLFANHILANNCEKDFYDDFLSFNSYDNKKITNVINLTALGELLARVKLNNNVSNQNIVLIHDNIEQFQETIKNELHPIGININFEDSSKHELLQMADNVASIVCHSFNKMQQHFKKQEEWLDSSEWDMKLYAKLLSKINVDNIKFTVPISDWAASLCVQKMFAQAFPPQLRNNVVFNSLYERNQRYIFDMLSNPSINTKLFQRALER